MESKLVSRNLILRFKGVIKALEGTKFGMNTNFIELTGPSNERITVAYNPFNKGWYDTKTNKYLPKGYTTPDGYVIDGDYAIVANLKNKQGVIRNYIQNKNYNNASPIQVKKQTEYNRKVSLGLVNPLNDADLTNTPASRFIGWKPKNQPTFPELFVSGDSNTNTTKSNTSSKSVLTKLAPSTKSRGNNKVVEFLKMLMSKGYNVGKTGADGIWGKNTQKAYELYMQDQKLLDLKPIESTPLVSPVTINLQQPGQVTKKWIPQGLDWRSNLLRTLSFSFLKNGGTLISRNPVKRFKSLRVSL